MKGNRPFIRIRSILALLLILSLITNFLSLGLSPQKVYAEVDVAPYVSSTVPANGAMEITLNSNITVNFSEAVNLSGSWFSLSCASSGTHTVTVTGGPTTFILDPDGDFVQGEACTLTVYAANVTDQDSDDPPDNMTTNFTAGFTTVIPPLPIGTVNGSVGNTDDGILHRSPYAPSSGNTAGQTVTIQGVIYEKTLQATSTANTYKGFYLQNTAATADTDPNTSDGIFVYMGTNTTIGGYTPLVGDEIVLSGKVSEYYYMTELSSSLVVRSVVRSGVIIDDEIPPVVVNPQSDLDNANRYWERLQGMRVQIPEGSIVLGGRNVFSPADAEIWLASPDSTVAQRTNIFENRAFRDAHPLDDNYDPVNWDGNGYRILMGSLGIKAAVNDAKALIDPARTFDTVTNTPSGGLNYTYSKYRIEVTEQPTFSEGVDPADNNPPDSFNRNVYYSIGDYNLENLYDYRDNPFSGCDFAGNAGCSNAGTPFLSAVNPPFDYVPASDAAYQARLNDIALQIINDLHNPDILMLQEVENQDICTVTDGAMTCGDTDSADGKPDTLQDLALKITSLGGPDYDAAFDRDSSDLRGIVPAFMYRIDRVELLPAAGDPILGANPAIGSYESVPFDGDVSNPKTLNAVLPAGITAYETNWVFPRAPDIGLFRIHNTNLSDNNTRDIYVINNHFKSGPDTCVAHRTEQAKYNAAIVDFIQDAKPESRIVLGGDLNIYPRPDDPFAPTGQDSYSDQLGSLYDSNLGLNNLWEEQVAQAPEAAYSYVYLGMAQTLDQMFVNQPMLADLEQYRVAHINSDFPADYPGDLARGTSDHDPHLAIFTINYPPFVDAGDSYTVTRGSSLILTASGTDPENNPLTYAWDLDSNGSFETPGQSITFSASTDSISPSITVSVQVTDNVGLIATDNASITVELPAPSSNSPENGATRIATRPAFAWSTVSGANYYWLTVATSPDYLPTITSAKNAPSCVIGADGIGIPATSYTPLSGVLKSGTTYYWRVQAYHGSSPSSPDQFGNYSQISSFTTATSSGGSISGGGGSEPLPANLSISSVDSPDSVNTGATITYSLNINNAGPGTARKVTVIDILPAGVTLISTTGDKWQISQSGSAITFIRYDSLYSGATASITITVTAPKAGGNITNTASVSSNTIDTDTTNNTVSITTAVNEPKPPSTVTPTPAVTATPTPSATSTASVTPLPTDMPTATASQVVSPSPLETIAPSESDSEMTSTPTPSPSSTPTQTVSWGLIIMIIVVIVAILLVVILILIRR